MSRTCTSQPSHRTRRRVGGNLKRPRPTELPGMSQEFGERDPEASANGDSGRRVVRIEPDSRANPPRRRLQCSPFDERTARTTESRTRSRWTPRSLAAIERCFPCPRSLGFGEADRGSGGISVEVVHTVVARVARGGPPVGAEPQMVSGTDSDALDLEEVGIGLRGDPEGQVVGGPDRPAGT